MSVLQGVDVPSLGERAARAPIPAARRTLSILGATGSVGCSTLDLVARHPDRFEIVAVTAQSNVDELARIAIEHRARLAVIADPQLYRTLVERLAGSSVAAAAGPAALIEAATMPADCVMAAIVGAAGLEPTFAAVQRGGRVALANKECLVSAGAMFMAAVREAGGELLPVDSEHSGILQALGGAPLDSVERITLTASGGPFWRWSPAQLATATPEQALKHPNWSMGRKISVDSATLMNKGLELIEASHLFPVGHDRLDIVVHPQSIVHCLVAYRDGSVMAQLATPDMRTPIALALGWPERIEAPTTRLDLARLGSLTFEAPNETRFPAPRLARQALVRGGSAPAILNAANEMAVDAFLDGRLPFLDIARVVATCLEDGDKSGISAMPATLADVLAVDAEARRLARNVIVRTTGIGC
jgi:1-deoxy-D-xylulose-5-phosphate reductoisomerase